MKTATNRKKLEKILDTALANYPHSHGIIEPFRPVLLEKARLVEGMESKTDTSMNLDEIRFKAGVPLSIQNSLFFPDDPWKDISLSLIPAIIKGFPALRPDLERLKGLIKKGLLDLREFVEATHEDSQGLIKKLSADHDITEQAVTFLAHIASRVILEKRSKDWAGLVKDFTWDKGFCPICGAAPMVARIDDGIAKRWLHCSQCGNEWTFSRVICPSCENRDQKAMDYFFIEGKEQESTFVCTKCKRYLITLNKLSDLTEFHGEVTALSLVHLDVLMQEKGYLPMASTEWNTF